MKTDPSLLAPCGLYCGEAGNLERSGPNRSGGTGRIQKRKQVKCPVKWALKLTIGRETFEIPPESDARVIGDEPCIALDFIPIPARGKETAYE